MSKQAANWSPYDNNGGSCVAIAGIDYCVIAADTRMSNGYSILTREYSKICNLADKSLMASSGFQADVKALQKFLAARHLGCVYTYDAVGSYERVGYGCQGSGSTLIMPFLDNQLKSPSPLLLPAQDAVTPLSETEAVDLVKTCFASATERDIYTGDKLEIVVLNADGIRREYMELRKD
ncbi:hypothetical protein Ddye_024643 [Dipteronia dyeriana]|uniref:Proteasome subunit beta n=1 Tax=Dipteronia dyeriana TaxID=168575 RepID=A0AAD9TW85_9ROSI|nr:hypothetical protein Ddye_024643 [Dipteronia dyeriana]